MKIIALCFLSLCSAGCGCYISYAISMRVKMLESIKIFFESIKTQTEFIMQPLNVMFNELSDRKELSCLPFIKECDVLLKDGTDFPTAWEKALSAENTRHLKKNDTELLLAFGSALGTTDINGQTSSCKLYTCLLENNLCEARKRKALWYKPAAGLGLLAGTAIYIIFI